VPGLVAQAAGPDAACASRPSDAGDSALLGAWIRGLQFADASQPGFGAVRVHHTPGAFDAAGTPYHDVVPYRASLGVAGLLRSAAGERLAIAERWIGWYLGHLEPDGSILDYWYRADGSGETTCLAGAGPAACHRQDSADSPAATLLGLAWSYHQAGGSAAFLRARQAALERVGGLLLGLQDADGLTWARDAYRVKFTMNNSEVAWGLGAMANLAQVVFRDRAAARRYADAARRARDGVRRDLFDAAAGLYRVARLEDGTHWPARLDEWYPGTVVVAWPHLHEVTAPDGPRAQTQMAALDASWDGLGRPDWTLSVVDPAGFLWPSIGHAALVSGDCARARAHLELVRAQRFPGLGYPFTVDDAGWLLRTLARFASAGP
jgi:hypothetical protein